MNPAPEPGSPKPASEHLVALAVAVREDWSAFDVRAALTNARTVGMSWERAHVELVRLMVRPETAPADLLLIATHRRRTHPDDPTPEYEAAKAALLEEDS